MELRPYQKDIIEMLDDHLTFDTKAVVTLAGGGGKSAIIAEIAMKNSYAKQHTVVLTNLSALIGQLGRHLDEFGIKYNIVKAGLHKQEPGCYVSLIMEQSYHEDKRDEIDIKCDVLLKDEFQIGTGQKRYEDIVKHLSPTSIIGFTFTPIDEKGYILKGLDKSQLISSIDVNELTDKGYLTPIKYYIPKFAEIIDYSSVSSSGNDFNGVEIDGIINTPDHTKSSIIAMNQLNAKSKKTLVYCASIEHAESMKKALDEDGYKTAIVHSKMPKQHNTNMIAQFQDKDVSGSLLETVKVDCLLSVMSLGIGFDSPNAKLLVMMRATKVKRLCLQIFARISRTYPGKEFGEILDLAQAVKYNGFLDEPIPIIKQGDKKALAKSKEPITVIEHIVNEEPTQITREIILDKLDEIKREEENIPSMSLENLSALFIITSSLYKAFEIAFEINKRTRGKSYKISTVEWVYKPCMNMIDKFPDYRNRLIKTFKTMIKNKVREGKNLNAMHYTPEWLMTQPPYSYGDDDFTLIPEDEIPF